MTDKVKAKALRPFLLGKDIVSPDGRAFDVSKHEFAALKARGLVVEAGGVKTEPESDAPPKEPEQAAKRGRPKKTEA